MNRLSPLVQQVTPALVPAAPQRATLELGTLERHASPLAPHTLFVPIHYEPNYGYPLLVWLHGCGDDERQLQRIMPLVSLRNYVGVSPRATSSLARKPGVAWRQDQHGIEQASEAVFQCIEQASSRYHINNQRIFIAGYGGGGTMALRIGLQHAERFAGALSLAGEFPSGQSPLARLSCARRLPLFLAQGRDAHRYSIDRSCDELRLFHAAGLSVTLRQYPCGDELTSHMLADMDRWMMELVTGIEHKPDPPSANEAWN